MAMPVFLPVFVSRLLFDSFVSSNRFVLAENESSGVRLGLELGQLRRAKISAGLKHKIGVCALTGVGVTFFVRVVIVVARCEPAVDAARGLAPSLVCHNKI